MATTSIISAVISKFEALTASGFPSSSRPPIYLDQAPLTDSAGAQENASGGYVILRDNGQVPSGEFERTTFETCDFQMEVYYASLADVDTAVLAIKRNGGAVGAGSGFDFGTLSDLSSPRSTHEIRRTRETRRLAGLSLAGARTYVCTLEYRVTVKESP
jgi:hypothetical protein